MTRTLETFITDPGHDLTAAATAIKVNKTVLDLITITNIKEMGTIETHMTTIGTLTKAAEVMRVGTRTLITATLTAITLDKPHTMMNAVLGVERYISLLDNAQRAEQSVITATDPTTGAYAVTVDSTIVKDLTYGDLNPHVQEQPVTNATVHTFL